MDLSLAQSFSKHEIENEKQNDFPGIKIDGKVAGSLYAISLDDDDADLDYGFKKTQTIPSGTVLKLNSYVIAKELLDQLNFKSISTKTSRAEIRKILDSKDPTALKGFYIKLAEKLRTAVSEEEFETIKKEIRLKKTEDDPNTTPYFKTGFVEVSPLTKSDIRYFIPLEKIKSLKVDAEEGKVTLLQSMNLLAFKKLQANVNGGFLSDKEVKELEGLEKTFTDQCNRTCQFNHPSVSELALNIIDIANFDFFKDLSQDASSMNEKVFLAQACLIKNYSDTCGNLKASAPTLLRRDGVKKILSKYSSLTEACDKEFR
jgi:hypothetical protein